HDLALEVTEIDHVEIDQPDAAYPRGGEVEAERRTEPAGADEQHAGGLEAFLAVHADLGHDEVPAVARDLGLRKVDRAAAQGVDDGVHGSPPSPRASLRALGVLTPRARRLALGLAVFLRRREPLAAPTTP